MIKRVITVMNGEVRRIDIQEMLELKNRENFINNYLNPALNNGYIEMTYPDKPNHPKQLYRLTKKGKEIKKQLK